MQEPNFTQEYQACIAHAGLYTISKNQSLIGHDEMLLGMYHHLEQTSYGHLLWELVGIRKPHWLADYISKSYADTLK